MKKELLFFFCLCFSSPRMQTVKRNHRERIQYRSVAKPNDSQQGRFEISKKVRVITTACTPDVQIIADSLINRLKLTSGITIKQTFENVTDEPVIRFVPQDGMPEEDINSLSLLKISPLQLLPQRIFLCSANTLSVIATRCIW